MATVTGYTAERMKQIEDTTVVDGDVVGDNLVLLRRDGVSIPAGNVRGPQGIQGVPGSFTSSPAGGALSGNYPDPGLADNAVTSSKVAASLKDAAAGIASMRTLGTGSTQAAAGNHTHGDTGWIDITPTAPGEAPFAIVGAVYFRYKKFGPFVHVQFRKDSSAVANRATDTSGNFSNTTIFPVGTVPDIATPDTNNVNGSARFADAYQSVSLLTSGAIVWQGGHPTNYATGSPMYGDFVFLTSK